jgi:DNA-binding NtrC family response regulator
MIVDDCDELRALFRIAFEQELRSHCLEMRSFSEVKEHRQEALGCQVAIIDINLGPGQPDGLEIHDWLRAQSFAGKIFFFTGHAADCPRVRKAAETGSPVLEKPMSPFKLVATIKDSIAEISGKSAVS